MRVAVHKCWVQHFPHLSYRQFQFALDPMRVGGRKARDNREFARSSEVSGPRMGTRENKVMHMAQIGDPKLLQRVNAPQVGKGIRASAQDRLFILVQRLNRRPQFQPLDLIPSMRGWASLQLRHD